MGKVLKPGKIHEMSPGCGLQGAELLGSPIPVYTDGRKNRKLDLFNYRGILVFGCKGKVEKHKSWSRWVTDVRGVNGDTEIEVFKKIDQYLGNAVHFEAGRKIKCNPYGTMLLLGCGIRQFKGLEPYNPLLTKDINKITCKRCIELVLAFENARRDFYDLYGFVDEPFNLPTEDPIRGRWIREKK